MNYTMHVALLLIRYYRLHLKKIYMKDNFTGNQIDQIFACYVMIPQIKMAYSASFIFIMILKRSKIFI